VVSVAGPLRILVTGSRRTTESEDRLVQQVLTRASADALSRRTVVIVQGECPHGGVDRAARKWAETHHPGLVSEGHPAAWAEHGKAAGPIRNSEMVRAGADLCIAFPRRGSRGTWDCIRKAAEAGIPVRIYPLDGAAGA
jgi:hypothetical protein